MEQNDSFARAIWPYIWPIILIAVLMSFGLQWSVSSFGDDRGTLLCCAGLALIPTAILYVIVLARRRIEEVWRR